MANLRLEDASPEEVLRTVLGWYENLARQKRERPGDALNEVLVIAYRALDELVARSSQTDRNEKH